MHSGLEVFARRRDDIRRVSFDPALRTQLRELLRWAEQAGVPCQETPERALSDLVDSKQHEGLVLAVQPRAWLPAKELARWLVQKRASAVALDRVRNPQNIGAILRSAAFFGVSAVILGAPAPHPGLSPFALRIAEGGAEHLRFTRTTDLGATLSQLASAGVQVIGTDSHTRATLADVPVRGASVLVLGNERVGLSPRIRECCQHVVGIQGSGQLDSLNVAVAAGVLFAELWRQRGS